MPRDVREVRLAWQPSGVEVVKAETGGQMHHVRCRRITLQFLCI